MIKKTKLRAVAPSRIFDTTNNLWPTQKGPISFWGIRRLSLKYEKVRWGPMNENKHLTTLSVSCVVGKKGTEVRRRQYWIW
jgi:hypothetical protein